MLTGQHLQVFIIFSCYFVVKKNHPEETNKSVLQAPFISNIILRAHIDVTLCVVCYPMPGAFCHEKPTLNKCV